MPGYERSRFVGISEKDLDEVTCSICHEVFNNPVVTPCCRQTYCKSCIEEWLTTQESCPNDRKSMRSTELTPPPRFAINLLNNMQIKCDYEENRCQITTTLEELVNHLAKCDRNPDKYCMTCDLPKVLPHDHNCIANMIIKNSIFSDQDTTDIKISLKCLINKDLFDVFYQLAINGNYEHLKTYFMDLEIIYRLLNEVKERRNSIHFIFQYLMDNDLGNGRKLVDLFEELYQNIDQTNSSNTPILFNEEEINKITKVKIGLELGTFLLASSWYDISKDVLKISIGLYDKTKDNQDMLKLVFECHWKLLSALGSFGYFNEANVQLKIIQDMIIANNIFSDPDQFNLAQVYVEFAKYFSNQFNYHESHKWALKSIKYLTKLTPDFTIIDACKQISKTFLINQDFKNAEIYFNHAMAVCREIFDFKICDNTLTIGIKHLKLAEVLLDYGTYMLDIKNPSRSIVITEMALNMLEYILGLNKNQPKNLLLSRANERLAYAIYALNYGTNNSNKANYYIDKAINIASDLISQDHYLFLFIKMGKVYILGEVARINTNTVKKKEILTKCQSISDFSLQLSKTFLGEMNLQTAKIYENLGRVNQKLRQYKEAEAFHLKSRFIREEILGSKHTQLSRSFSCLAWLYFSMKLYNKAEHFFLQSNNILAQVYGEEHRDLSFDYRGLCIVYKSLGKQEKVQYYQGKLDSLKSLQDKSPANLILIRAIDSFKKLSLEELILGVK